MQSSVELVYQVRGLCPKLSSADVPVSPKYPEHRARGTENRAQTSLSGYMFRVQKHLR